MMVALVLLLIQYSIHTAAGIVNLRALNIQLPEEFRGWYDADRYRDSQNYLRANTLFSVLSSSMGVMCIILFTAVGGFGFLEEAVHGFSDNFYFQTVLFSILLITGVTIYSIPFAYYKNFVLEERFGFNTMTGATFIADTAKGYILSMILGGLLYTGIITVFQLLGTQAWIWAWIIYSLFQIILIILAPVLIMPLFNTFTPMNAGPLREKIKAYAEKINFSFSDIYSMDGSRRSRKSNAFFTGFGKYRKIALFDTLTEKMDDDEVVAVLAHEMGHFKKRHMLYMVTTALISGFALFALLGYLMSVPQFYLDFSISSNSLYFAPVIFAFFAIPLQMILGIISNYASRKYEFQADRFAAQTNDGNALIRALKKLCVENLANLNPNPFKVILEYSHPPVLHRIRNISKNLDN
jgi:STE24 endopeptidase